MKKIFLLFASVCAFFVCLHAAAAAQNTAGFFPDGLVGISNRGMIFEYPENSRAGILAAAETGIDGVLVDVSLSKDGVPVVMEKESAVRMLDGARTPSVSDYTLAELQAFHLRNRLGGEHNAVTEHTVSTLEDLLSLAVAQGFTLVPRFDVSILENVLAVVEQNDAADTALLFITGPAADVQKAVETYGKSFFFFTEKRSNIVFSVLSYMQRMGDAGAAGVNLKTANRYGVIYYKWVLSRLPAGVRAVADTSDPATCGAREDCEKWWDDLVSRGYSVIITDDPAAFVAYKNNCAAARTALQSACDYAEAQMETPVYKKTLGNDYKKAFDDAISEATYLLDSDVSAARDLKACTAALYKAMKEIDRHFEALTDGTAGLTVTPARIALCVLAAAAVLAAQIYFFKRRKGKA